MSAIIIERFRHQAAIGAPSTGTDGSSASVDSPDHPPTVSQVGTFRVDAGHTSTPSHSSRK